METRSEICAPLAVGGTGWPLCASSLDRGALQGNVGLRHGGGRSPRTY